MRHGHFVLLALFPLIAAPSAYAQSRSSTAPLNDADVVARIMSFDRNNDGRIEKHELVERMHVLVARGDVNGDAALDGRELRTLAKAQQPPVDHRVIIISGPYVFAEEVGQTSRLRIEGALDDLRLEAGTRTRAGAVAASYAEALDEKTVADLIAELDPLLTTDQFLDMVLALNGRGSRILETINGELVVAVKRSVVTTGRGRDLLRRIAAYGLTAQQLMAAEAAVERYDGRIRLGQAERTELLDQLKDLLSDEERENLGAALARRPLVSAGSPVPNF
jgi:hypothetical protein